MNRPLNLTRAIIVAMAFCLCGGPQLVAAQQSPNGDEAQQTQSETPSQTNSSSQDSATPDPSRGPLAPSETTLPNAPSSARDQQTTTPPPAPSQESTSKQSQRPIEPPVGVGAAQAGRVSGGPASRPAGTAIAPAKQRQVRSLLIKVGAIAAGAAAFGIVYGLSRSSPSVPPGAATAGTPAGQQQP
jgi:hypothetical protein